jgi:NAD(P)-dependent dehydrogenase (short-subunit alcohol dehydrogenase family)
VQADITDPQDCRLAIEECARLGQGQVDFAFNNAGYLHTPEPLHTMEDDCWNHSIAVNLTGCFFALRAEIKQMIGQKSGGSIVNTASINSVRGSPGFAAYTAAKHGLIGLTRTAALEYCRKGIRINAVCPGGIDTPMMAALIDTPEKENASNAFHPIGRRASAGEIVDALLAVASPRFSFMIGEAVMVDGGLAAGPPSATPD